MCTLVVLKPYADGKELKNILRASGHLSVSVLHCPVVVFAFEVLMAL